MNILAFTISSGLGKTAPISLPGMWGLWEKWSISSGGLYGPLHGGSSVQEEPLRAAGIIAGAQPRPPSRGLPTLCSLRAALRPSITRVYEHVKCYNLHLGGLSERDVSVFIFCKRRLRKKHSPALVALVWVSLQQFVFMYPSWRVFTTGEHAGNFLQVYTRQDSFSAFSGRFCLHWIWKTMLLHVYYCKVSFAGGKKITK